MVDFAHYYKRGVSHLRLILAVALVIAVSAFASVLSLGSRPASAEPPEEPSEDNTPAVHDPESIELPLDKALPVESDKMIKQGHVVTVTPRKARPKIKPKPKPRRRKRAARVAGLSAEQTANARAIVAEGQALHVPYRGQVVALATALRESTLHVYANPSVPSSFNVQHSRVGYDHDSVGLFQQRVPMWGTAWQCMNPRSSAKKFYQRLTGINGWQRMRITVAAQSVQGSAYPEAYALTAAEAFRIRAAL